MAVSCTVDGMQWTLGSKFNHQLQDPSPLQEVDFDFGDMDPPLYSAPTGMVDIQVGDSGYLPMTFSSKNLILDPLFLSRRSLPAIPFRESDFSTQRGQIIDEEENIYATIPDRSFQESDYIPMGVSDYEHMSSQSIYDQIPDRLSQESGYLSMTSGQSDGYQNMQSVVENIYEELDLYRHASTQKPTDETLSFSNRPLPALPSGESVYLDSVSVDSLSSVKCAVKKSTSSLKGSFRGKGRPQISLKRLARNPFWKRIKSLLYSNLFTCKRP